MHVRWGCAVLPPQPPHAPLCLNAATPLSLRSTSHPADYPGCADTYSPSLHAVPSALVPLVLAEDGALLRGLEAVVRSGWPQLSQEAAALTRNAEAAAAAAALAAAVAAAGPASGTAAAAGAVQEAAGGKNGEGQDGEGGGVAWQQAGKGGVQEGERAGQQQHRQEKQQGQQEQKEAQEKQEVQGQEGEQPAAVNNSDDDDGNDEQFKEQGRSLAAEASREEEEKEEEEEQATAGDGGEMEGPQLLEPPFILQSNWDPVMACSMQVTMRLAAQVVGLIIGSYPVVRRVWRRGSPAVRASLVALVNSAAKAMLVAEGALPELLRGVEMHQGEGDGEGEEDEEEEWEEEGEWQSAEEGEGEEGEKSEGDDGESEEEEEAGDERLLVVGAAAVTMRPFLLQAAAQLLEAALAAAGLPTADGRSAGAEPAAVGAGSAAAEAQEDARKYLGLPLMFVCRLAGPCGRLQAMLQQPQQKEVAGGAAEGGGGARLGGGDLPGQQQQTLEQGEEREEGEEGSTSRDDALQFAVQHGCCMCVRAAVAGQHCSARSVGAIARLLRRPGVLRALQDAAGGAPLPAPLAAAAATAAGGGGRGEDDSGRGSDARGAAPDDAVAAAGGADVNLVAALLEVDVASALRLRVGCSYPLCLQLEGTSDSQLETKTCGGCKVAR